MKGLALVSESVHDIPWRVRAINDRYRIYYNKIKSRYELHAQGAYPSLQLVLPYDRLDARTVDYVNRTRIERSMEDILKIDQYNQNLVDKCTDAILDKAIYKANSLGRYLQNGGENIPSYEEL